jgi:hypothetical protein
MAMAEDEIVLQAIKGSSLSSHDIVFRSMAMIEDGTVKQMEGLDGLCCSSGAYGLCCSSAACEGFIVWQWRQATKFKILAAHAQRRRCWKFL